MSDQAPNSNPGAAFELGAWLRGLGLQQYEAAFVANHIDRELLPDLSAQDLIDLGLTSVGHRRRLLQAIAQLQGGAVAPVVSASASPLPAAASDPSNLSTVSAQTAALTPPAPAPAQRMNAERRQFTVMFCDLVGSTELSARLDPEDLGELITAYRSAVSVQVTRFRGHIAQYLGDGVLVYFGYPQSNERDAERAVRAALAILAGVAQLPPVAGAQAQVRIGIATGLVLIDQRQADGVGSELGAIGETPNLAARLQGVAQPGEAALSAQTKALVGELFACTHLGEFELKGFAQPVPAWRVDAERADVTRFQALHGAGAACAMAGRAAELQQLLSHWQLARRGKGQLIVVQAAPGMGKSRLLAELLHQVQAQVPDAAPLVLQCSPDQQQTPWHPFTQRLSSTPFAQDEGLTPLQRDALNLLLQPTQLSESLRQLRPNELRQTTMDALLLWLLPQARAAGILVLEDAHWADPSSDELMQRLARSAANEALLVVATTRPPHDPSTAVTQPQERAHAWLDQAPVLSLSRLDSAEALALARTVADGVLDDTMLAQVVQRCDGVPIYLTELTRLLVSSWRARGQPRPGSLSVEQDIPSTLTEALLARLDQIEHGTETAQLAAVLGRDFSLALLCAIAPDAARTRQSAQRLAEAGIFVAQGEAQAPGYSFAHMLMRDAAYQMLMRRSRAELHRKTAQTLERDFAAVVQTRPELLAHHYAEAGDIQAAIGWGEQAARRALQRSAAWEAMAHLRTALARVPALANANVAERNECELTLQLTLVGPQLQVHGYGAPEVAQTVERALVLCETLGARHRMVPALTLKWLAQLGSQNMGAAYAQARLVYEAAQSGSLVDRLLGWRVWGSAQMFNGEFEAALAALDQFLLHHSPEHDEALNAVGATFHAQTVLLARTEVLSFLGRTVQAQAAREQALSAARARAHPNSLCQVLAFCGGLLCYLGQDTEGMAAFGEEVEALSAEHQLAAWRPFGQLLTGMAQALRGEVAGLATARAGVDALLLTSQPMLSTWCILLAQAYALAGQAEAGLSTLALAKARVEDGERWLAAEYHRLQGWLLHQTSGPIVQVRQHLQTALRIASEQQAAPLLARARHTLAQCGYADEAQAVAERKVA